MSLFRGKTSTIHIKSRKKIRFLRRKITISGKCEDYSDFEEGWYVVDGGECVERTSRRGTKRKFVKFILIREEEEKKFNALLCSLFFISIGHIQGAARVRYVLFQNACFSPVPQCCSSVARTTTNSTTHHHYYYYCYSTPGFFGHFSNTSKLGNIPKPEFLALWTRVFLSLS